MVFLSFTLIFVVLHILPGDPVLAILGTKATPEMIAQMRHQLGLDKPLIIQYFDYLINVLRGDLGQSITSHLPVIDEISSRLPTSIELTIGGAIVAIIIGIFGGVMSAVRKDSIVDYSFRVFSFLFYSMPFFLIALVFQLFFSVRLGVLPLSGVIDPYIAKPPTITGLLILDSLLRGNIAAFRSNLEHMILPWLTIGLLGSTIICRIARASMIDALEQDYVDGARARGTTKFKVVYKHALRNALLPVVSVIGVEIAWMITGAVIVEYIFSLPGIGSRLLTAIYQRDFPVIQGTMIIFTLIVTTISLSIDIIYAFLDPRIRY